MQARGASRRGALLGLALCALALVGALVLILGRDQTTSAAGFVPEVAAPDAPTGSVPARSAVDRGTTDASSAIADVATRSARLEDVVPARPIGLAIGGIEVAAPVVEVGVDPSGALEIPGAQEVGWYRNGPVPGAPGSSVLAAHVDQGGRPGVFFELGQVEPGTPVAVGFSDGTVQWFEIVGRRSYAKDQLPAAQLFASEGPPVLTLITCGGSFDAETRSYSDNLVAYAVPSDP